MKERMKIVQVSPVFPPHIGGVEKYVFNISKQFARMGNKVVVYTTNLPKEESFKTDREIVIHRIPVLFRMFNVPVTLYLNIFRENPQIVHVHIPPPTGVLSSIILMGKLKKKPVILTYHNDTIGNGLIQRFLAKLYNTVQDGFILRNVTSITVPSKDYKKKLLAKGLNERKIKVIPGGVDLDPANINCEYAEIERVRKKYNCEHRKIVLCVGALESRKGIEYLIKATPSIVRELPNTKIVIVGSGGLSNKLRHLVHALKVDSFISFLGHVTDKELSILYEASNVFVLPSLYETFGLVLLEAMAHGIPIVATRIHGVSNLIEDHHNGILVEPRNSDELSKAVIDVLSNNTLATTLGQNATEFVKAYSWEQTALKIYDAYKSVMKASK